MFVKDGRRRFRLNRSGPDGRTTFSEPVELPTLPGLSTDSDFAASVGPEAYLGLVAMYHHSWTYARGEAYFVDVNADNLPDYVSQGRVWFNHLDENGVPTFSTTSQDTKQPVPGTAKVDRTVIRRFLDDVREQREDFPVQDTVRRWVAPWTGTIAIDAPVHVTGDSADGVRVAVQHNDRELWSAVIPGGDHGTRVPEGVTGIRVERGDRIYFRLQPRSDSTGDQVAWDPVIEYPDRPAVRGVNGLDAYRYQASRDFTLAGRPGIGVGMPLDGTVRVQGSVTKSAPTTDDLRVLVLRNDKVVAERRLEADATGSFPVEAEFTVQGPRPGGRRSG